MKIIHKKGDQIYVPTSLYVYRGADDFIGGLATIKDFDIAEYLDEGHVNKVMVSILERPGTSYNYKILLEKQEDLKNEFGEDKAYADPDLDTEFNNHDEGWK